MNVDWENLGKRLIAASQIGVRIEQDSGHRWIFTDPEADFIPDCLVKEEYTSKIYGSYQSALDEIDRVLKANSLSSLLEQFDDLNRFDDEDLGFVFGEGTQ